MRKLVLASTSPFRREILQKLNLPFEAANPETDETPIKNETPAELVGRLAELKARAVVEQYPDALIIGSDQVAVIDGQILGKPGTHEKAVQQLTASSGREVKFLTGLSLLDSLSSEAQTDVVPFSVFFRELTHEQIESYLHTEKPYHSAGSFKSEGLGITLFEKMVGDDPNTLIGLPLIRLVKMLNIKDMDPLKMIKMQ